MKKIAILLFLMSIPYSHRTQEQEEVVDFSSIKELIKKDNLSSQVERKKKKEQKKKKILIQREIRSFDFPNENDFLSFFSELWLIKNSDLLNWDFEAPDYGIEEYFQKFLENVGKIGVRFKIILINTPKVAHFALPSGENEHIFVLSLPFLRALKLSKVQISLLLFEDLLRSEGGIFTSSILNEKLKKLLGKNLHKKPFPQEVVAGVFSQYDRFIFEIGFNFKQQFQITKMVSRAIDSNPEYSKAYREMVEKKDTLIKTNLTFKDYPKIYPSPELQKNWLISHRDPSL